MIYTLTSLRRIKQVEQLICFKRIFFLLFLLIPSIVFSSGHKIKELKCESGANPGHIKRWNYNKEDLIEIYPNGYRRVYDVKSINKNNILAVEDSKRGVYYVTISFNENGTIVDVITPLVKYTDSNCKELN
tara:strand:+ start:183 stop:575 length:393 start_codon:yes stop_codon:yes gene_type:complete